MFHPKAMPCILEQGAWQRPAGFSHLYFISYCCGCYQSFLPPSWLWLLACVRSSCQRVDLVHSRFCLVAVLTLSFSLVISQLEQFLDTEVLFHHKSEPQDSGLNFLHFNPTYAANCKHRAKVTLLECFFFCFFLTCCRLQKGGGRGWGGWGGVGGGLRVFTTDSARKWWSSNREKWTFSQYVVALLDRRLCHDWKGWWLIVFAGLRERFSLGTWC